MKRRLLGTATVIFFASAQVAAASVISVKITGDFTYNGGMAASFVAQLSFDPAVGGPIGPGVYAWNLTPTSSVIFAGYSETGTIVPPTRYIQDDGGENTFQVSFSSGDTLQVALVALNHDASVPDVGTVFSPYADHSLFITASYGSPTLANLAISSVPEPSTWVMMLAGFAGLGFAGFRARRTSVAAL